MNEEHEEPAEIEELERLHDEEANIEDEEEKVPPIGSAKLVLKRGGVLTDLEFSVFPPATIGRFDPSVGPIDVDLGAQPEGSYVSRKHAKIIHDGEVWKIVDLGSSNGTFLLRDDFERVEEAEIVDGQEFALGNARFVFMVVE